ncbi:acyl-homoserine-lactone synthase [Sphingopyxis chilensis]|uniref:acyl-homoserine-lactone synthase n=1 Tax=Sphingopyxis chilensis TaxID=180400 RepID=UPI002DDD4ACF|nr:acyl-homoserine-lactone synthase [Sphingopyxis chilensis]
MPTCDAAPPRGWIDIRRAQAESRRARAADAAPRRASPVMLVVDQTMRAHEHVALRSMFAARKRVFVDLLNWDLPVLAGRYEVDRRDRPGATYLIIAGADGEHLASARLLPETAASLRRFEERIFEPGASNAGVAEVTHFCLSPDITSDARRRARDQLLYGLVDHALARHIQCFLGIAEPRLARRIEGLGWACRRLGAIHSSGGRDMVAVAVDVDAATPARLAGAGIARPTASWPMSS